MRRHPSRDAPAIERLPNRAYDAAVARLRPERLGALREAEAEILADPEHGKYRTHRANGTIVDMMGDDLLVTYRIVAGRVEFLDVDDLRA
jgi:hypothetical protein